MKKRLLALVLAAVTILTSSALSFSVYANETNVWNGEVSTSITGNGTSTDPYLINTADDLAFLAKKVNDADADYSSAYYKLNADIYLNDITNYSAWETTAPAQEWVPIGHTNAFSGTFDGNNKTIYGMYISQPSGNNVGLFGLVDGSGTTDGAKIFNLKIADSLINMTLSTQTVGAVVGNCLGGVKLSGITNETVQKIVVSKTSDRYVGGIVGTASSTVELSSCVNAGSISVTEADGIASATSVGGIVGCVGRTVDNCDSQITSCHNVAAISIYGKGVGGIIGFSKDDVEPKHEDGIDVDTCYNLGEIKNHKQYGGAGGIIGYARTNLEIKNCVNIGTIANTYGGNYAFQMAYTHKSVVLTLTTCYYNEDNGSKIVGGGTTSTSTASCTGLSYAEEEFTNTLFPGIEDLIRKMDDSNAPDGGGNSDTPDIEVSSSLEGQGTETSPFLVGSLADLLYMRNQINSGSNNTAYYKLTADIYLNDLTNYKNWGTQSPTNVWTPIGKSNSYKFQGHFDGDGHTVYGMYMSGNYQYAGFFGYISGTAATSKASVSNLRISHSYICVGEAPSSCGVGGVAGYVNNTDVINCSSDTDIKVLSVAEGNDVFVGGIVGTAKTGKYIISNCSNSGNIDVTNTAAGIWSGVGGILGYGSDRISNNGIISNCYNVGNINFSIAKGVAGIVGTVGFTATEGCATVSDCYNAGTISCDSGDAGGIMGFSRYGATIERCFNIGKADGKQIISNARGGVDAPVVVVDCYYNSDFSQKAGGAGASKLSYMNGEFVSKNMSKLTSNAWNLVDGEIPTLKNVYEPNEIDLLGAQIRYNHTEYYRNGEKITEGQGIRFGASLNNCAKYMNGNTLADGYSVGVIIAAKSTLNGAELTIANAEVDAANSMVYSDGNLMFSAYIVGIDQSGYSTEYVARAYIKDSNGVIFYTEEVIRSVNSVASNMNGTIIDGFFYRS